MRVYTTALTTVPRFVDINIHQCPSQRLDSQHFVQGHSHEDDDTYQHSGEDDSHHDNERQHSLNSSRASEQQEIGRDGISPPKDFRASLSEQVAAHTKAQQADTSAGQDDDDNSDTYR